MFIRLTKKPNDRVSVRIVENKRVNGKIKQVTITGIGTSHKDDHEKIASLKRVAEGMMVNLKNDIDPVIPGLEIEIHSSKAKIPKDQQDDMVSIAGLKEEGRIHKGIDDIFGNAFETLNLQASIDTGYKKDDANNLFKEMVLARISNPVSKRKIVKNLQKDKDIEIDLDKFYRMMDKVYLNEDRIRTKISTSTLDLFNQKIDVAFFDVTTLYFESFTPDDLRVSGFSKDGKFKETQVMLALITTIEGLPLGYELFPGNSYEGNTLITVIDQLEKNYDLSETFIVADRAMFTKVNLEKLDSKKVKFIVAAKLRTLKKELKDQITNDLAKVLEENESIDGWTKDYVLEGRRLIVSYDKKRAAKDKKDRERLVERVNKKMKNGKVRLADLINNTGTKKYLKIDKNGSKEATLNETKIKEDEKWDGIHGVITNHHGDDLSSSEILKRYRNLWQIEAAFRVNKHDLKMRPIFHWTENRIKSHILICFVAYSLSAFVKHKLKTYKINLSFEEIREELGRVQTSIVKDIKTGKTFMLPSKLTGHQKEIYKAFGLIIDNKTKILKTP